MDISGCRLVTTRRGHVKTNKQPLQGVRVTASSGWLHYFKSGLLIAVDTVLTTVDGLLTAVVNEKTGLKSLAGLGSERLRENGVISSPGEVVRAAQVPL